MDFSWQFWGFLVSAAFGGLRDGMAHELSKAEAKDWDMAILDAGHLVATQADKALLVKIWHGFWSGKSRDTQMDRGFLTIQVACKTNHHQWLVVVYNEQLQCLGAELALT